MAQNNIIKDFISAGSDAFANMYELIFKFPYLEDPQCLTIRSSGIKIPEFTPKTYDKKHHGISYTALAPELTGTRVVEIEFSVDSNYYLYTVAKSLAHEHGNISTGGVANTYGEAGEILVYMMGGEYTAPQVSGIAGNEGTPMDNQIFFKNGVISNINGGKIKTFLWRMGDAHLIHVSEPEAKHEDASPVKVKFKYIVNDFDYPQGVGVSGTPDMYKIK